MRKNNLRKVVGSDFVRAVSGALGGGSQRRTRLLHFPPLQIIDSKIFIKNNNNIVKYTITLKLGC